MTDYMFICSCSGVKEKSAKAFKILKPEAEMPEPLVGKDRMRAVAEKMPSDSNAAKYIQALAKKNGRFAYYVSVDDNLNIAEMYDLLTGKRLA